MGKNSQKAAAGGLEHFNSPQRIDPSGHLIGFEDSAFILKYGKSTRLPSLNYPTAKMTRVDLRHPENKAERWTVAAPKNMNDNGVAICLVAPSCDRILWIVDGDTTAPFLQKLKSYIPGSSASAGIGCRWLVSGLHGEEMHEVASYRSQRGPAMSGSADTYSRPRWMPDGRHISFVYRDTLYVRPVD